MGDSMEVEVALLKRDNRQLQEAVESIKESHVEISKSLSALVMIEGSLSEMKGTFTRIFDKCESFDTRLKVVEVSLPSLIETRTWIINGILAVVGIVGIAMVYMVVNH